MQIYPTYSVFLLGIVYVRLGYRATTEIAPPSYSTNIDPKFWNSLSRLNIPQKLKVSMWRLIHDDIPSGVALRFRGVPFSRSFPFCGVYETSFHSIFRCPCRRKIWSGTVFLKWIQKLRQAFTIGFLMANWSGMYSSECETVNSPLIEEISEDANNWVHEFQKAEM